MCQRDVVVDIAKAKGVLGWQPTKFRVAVEAILDENGLRGKKNK